MFLESKIQSNLSGQAPFHESKKERSSTSVSYQQWHMNAKHGLLQKALVMKLETSHGKENAKCQAKTESVTPSLDREPEWQI